MEHFVWTCMKCGKRCSAPRPLVCDACGTPQDVAATWDLDAYGKPLEKCGVCGLRLEGTFGMGPPCHGHVNR